VIGFNSILDTEERISELEKRSVKMIPIIV
jgi:hypothetical protein